MTLITVHKMTQFLGKPQGPLSSSLSVVAAAGCACAGFFVVAAAAGAEAEVVASFFAAPAGFESALPSSHAKLTLLTISQKLLPWTWASSSSLAEGCREPSPAAKVPAPQGLPPRTSLKSARMLKALA